MFQQLLTTPPPLSLLTKHIGLGLLYGSEICSMAGFLFQLLPQLCNTLHQHLPLVAKAKENIKLQCSSFSLIPYISLKNQTNKKSSSSLTTTKTTTKNNNRTPLLWEHAKAFSKSQQEQLLMTTQYFKCCFL